MAVTVGEAKVRISAEVKELNLEIQNVKTKLQGLKSDARLKFIADVTGFENRIRAITQQVEKFKDQAKIKFEADVSVAEKQFKAISDRSQQLKQDAKLKYTADITDAQAKVKALEAENRKVREQARIKFGADPEVLKASLREVRQSIAEIQARAKSGLIPKDEAKPLLADLRATKAQLLETKKAGRLQFSIDTADLNNKLNKAKNDLAEFKKTAQIKLVGDVAEIDKDLAVAKKRLQDFKTTSRTKLDADTTLLDKKLKEAKTRLQTFKAEQRLKLSADTADAERKILELKRKILELKLHPPPLPPPTGIDKFIAPFKEANAQANKFLGKLGISTRDIAVLFGAGLVGGVVFGLRAIGQAIAASIEAFSALKEQQSATNALFTEGAKVLHNFANIAAAGLGLSTRAALEAGNKIGTFVLAAGALPKQAAQISASLVALAANLASFRDTTPEQALRAFTSALAGEFEPLRNLGITLSALAVQQNAVKLGLVQSGETAGSAAKVFSTLDLILQQASVSSGDLGRTSESLANKQRQLAAQAENTKARLGETFEPVANSLLGLAIPALEKFSAKFIQLKDLLSNPISTTAFDPLVGLDVTNFVPGVKQIKSILEKGLDVVGFKSRAKSIEEAFKKAGISLQELSVATGLSVRELTAGTKSVQEAVFNATGLTVKEFKALQDKGTLAGLTLQQFIDLVKQTGTESARAVIALQQMTLAFQELARVTIIRADVQFRSIDLELEHINSRLPELGKSYEKAASKGVDSAERLARAQEDAAVREQNAREALAKAQRESQKSQDDARRKLAETERDQARKVQDAEKKLSKAFEETTKAGKKATEDLVRTRITGFRRLRDAEQEFADFEQDLQGVGGLTIEEARRRRDLEESVADARFDFADAIKEANEKIAEIEKDNAEKISEAEQGLADARLERDEKIAESQRALAEAQIDAFERTRDAQQALDDAIRDGARAIADASKAAAAGTKELSELTVAEFNELNRQGIDRLKQFDTGLNAIGDRLAKTGRESIVGHLMFELNKLGPEAAPLIEKLSKATEPEFEKFVSQFQERTAEAKKGLDTELDKYPPNIRAQLTKINQTTLAAINVGIGQLDRLKDQPEEMQKAAKESLNALVDHLIRAADEGKFPIDNLTREMLTLGRDTDDAKTKVEILRGSVAGLDGTSATVHLDANTGAADAKLKAVIDRLNQRQIHVLHVEAALAAIAGDTALHIQLLEAALQIGRAQHGGRFKSGELAIVGEAGPELVRFKRPAEVFSNERSRELIGGETNYNITVNQVAEDPRATANAVAARLGQKATR